MTTSHHSFLFRWCENCMPSTDATLCNAFAIFQTKNKQNNEPSCRLSDEKYAAKQNFYLPFGRIHNTHTHTFIYSLTKMDKIPLSEAFSHFAHSLFFLFFCLLLLFLLFLCARFAAALANAFPKKLKQCASVMFSDDAKTKCFCHCEMIKFCASEIK